MFLNTVIINIKSLKHLRFTSSIHIAYKLITKHMFLALQTLIVTQTHYSGETVDGILYAVSVLKIELQLIAGVHLLLPHLQST